MFILPNHINYSHNLSIHEKNLLRCLSDHCGDKDICWPSTERIARFMNVTSRTVRKYLKRITELKFVEVIRRRGKSNLYKMLCLEERLPTPRKQYIPTEQTIPKKNNVCKRPIDSDWKPPLETQALVNEIEQATGDRHSRGAFYTIARNVDVQSIYSALSVTKFKIMTESGVNAGGYFIGCIRNLTGFMFGGTSKPSPPRPPDRPRTVLQQQIEPEPPPCAHDEAMGHIANIKKMLLRT